MVQTEPKIKGEPVDIYANINDYDFVVVCLSAGKDSIGCMLWAIENGVDMSKLRIVHQCVDGMENTHEEFMDWPCTHAYIKAMADYFGIHYSFQWRARGILGEMERVRSQTGHVYYKDAEETTICLPTTRGKETTRMMWPAKSPDLTRRWCSSYVKVDVFRRYLNNHPDYQGTNEDPSRILVLTGERREESANRARYLKSELHPCHSATRIVHAHRPIIDYSEGEVWALLQKYSIRPHPAYQIGFSRVSCMSCIFLNPDLWAIVKAIAPERFARLVRQEQKMNHTLDAKKSLDELADQGTIYDRMPLYDPRLPEWVDLALGTTFTVEDLIMKDWELPAGAFQGSCGGAL